MSNRGRPVDHTGSRFGRLLVLFEGPRNKWNRKTWVCRCDCGTEKTIAAYFFVSGDTTSCGCFRAEMIDTFARTHGKSYTRTHRIWRAMLTRCNNPKTKSFINYGGRGIKVCDRWANSFENFFEDMGEAPADKSIDRYPNNDGNYEPGNCRWATAKEQARNSRHNRFIWFKGKERLLVEICEMTGLWHGTIRHRSELGIPLDDEPYASKRRP